MRKKLKKSCKDKGTVYAEFDPKTRTIYLSPELRNLADLDEEVMDGSILERDNKKTQPSASTKKKRFQPSPSKSCPTSRKRNLRSHTA